MSDEDRRTCFGCGVSYINCDCCPDSVTCSTECAVYMIGCVCDEVEGYHAHRMDGTIDRKRPPLPLEFAPGDGGWYWTAPA